MSMNVTSTSLLNISRHRDHTIPGQLVSIPHCPFSEKIFTNIHLDLPWTNFRPFLLVLSLILGEETDLHLTTTSWGVVESSWASFCPYPSWLALENPLLTCLPFSILQIIRRTRAEVQIYNRFTCPVGAYSHTLGMCCWDHESAGCRGSLPPDVLKAVVKWHHKNQLLWMWQCFHLVPASWREKFEWLQVSLELCSLVLC